MKKVLACSFRTFTRGEVTSKATHTLGEGAFAFVYLETLNGQKVAVKAAKAGFEEDLLVEIKNVVKAALAHPNIMTYLGSDMDKVPRLVMEFLPDSQDLFAVMEQLSPEQVRFTLQGLTDALEYLHSKDITHRDVKPENVLMDSTRTIPKLYDFASAVFGFEFIDTKAAGTKEYLPNEILVKFSEYLNPVTRDRCIQEIYQTPESMHKFDVHSLMVLALELLVAPYTPLPFEANPTEARLMNTLTALNPKQLEAKFERSVKDIALFRAIVNCWHPDFEQRGDITKLRDLIHTAMHEPVKVDVPVRPPVAPVNFNDVNFNQEFQNEVVSALCMLAVTGLLAWGFYRMIIGSK